MAIVVEAGTGAAASVSYVTVAEVRAFIGSIALPTATDAEVERAAVLATRYLDGKYRHRLKGQRTYPTVQALEFPRVGVRLIDEPQEYYGVTPSFYDSEYSAYLALDAIPQDWKDACCELALRALTAPLAADIAATDRVKRKKIDVLEWEYDISNFQTSYPVVEQLISRFLRSGNDAVRG